jgi:SIR2-like domain
MNQRITLLLGAGASRAVSYAQKKSFRSPLDSDFFELLQRMEPRAKDEPAISELIAWILASRDPIWTSMERTFYTLHVRARMSELLFPEQNIEATASRLLGCFTRSIDALLREAHGTESCESHIHLLQRMRSSDAVITFNYDLVTERALRKLVSTPCFGDWIYGFRPRPANAANIPTIYKLHGSVNWTYQDETRTFKARQESWAAFDKEPGYRAHTDDSFFPIMLPFWDKKIEDKPWSEIWKRAAAHLNRCSQLIVWGYSLPQTDLKALELLKLSLGTGCLEDVCVIDPAGEVRTKWRAMFPSKKFWPYEKFEDFLLEPPNWW